MDMYNEIAGMECDAINEVLAEPQEVYTFILGKQPESVPIDKMLEMCIITGRYITRIYDSVTTR